MARRRSHRPRRAACASLPLLARTPRQPAHRRGDPARASVLARHRALLGALRLCPDGDRHPAFGHELGASLRRRPARPRRLQPRRLWRPHRHPAVASAAPRSASSSARSSACCPAMSAAGSTMSLQRLLEALISIPFLVLALIAIAAAGPELAGNPLLVVLVVALVYAPRIARMARAAAIDIATRDFVTVARLRGRERLVGDAARAAAQCHQRAAGRVRAARRLCAGADRLARLPRLRHAAADAGMGPDDQREPQPAHHLAGDRAGPGPDAGLAGRRPQSLHRGPGAHPRPHRAARRP